MPPAVAAAAIGAGAGIGGALISSHSQGKASDAQARATADTLAFERDKETRKRQEYDQAMQEYRQRYAQWEQQRNGLLARYGVHPGGRPSLASFGQRPTQSPTTGQAPMFGPQGMGAQNMGGPSRLSLADFSGQRQPGAV